MGTQWQRARELSQKSQRETKAKSKATKSQWDAKMWFPPKTLKTDLNIIVL